MILSPHRFTNLNYCLVKVTSLIIECLISRGASSLQDLLFYCESESQDVNDQDITLAVSFLYLLNKATYVADDDLVMLMMDK